MTDAPTDANGNETAAARLLEHIEGIERELDLKAEIEQRIRDRKAIAKGEGFDIKTMNAIIRERRMDADKIAQEQALLDVYRAALGMLDGTPLGDYTRKMIDEELRKRRGDDSKAPDPKSAGAKKPPGGGMANAPGGLYRPGSTPDDAEAPAPRAPEPAPPPPRPVMAPAEVTPEVVEAARAEGRQWAREGRSLMLNPYPAGDRRRAAFDEGWCAEMQSDGMDLPAAFRRPPKPKKDDAAPDTTGAKKPDGPDAPASSPDQKGGPGR